MISRIKRTIAEYPLQFWVLFCARFIGSAGGSLVWPFLTIYLRQRLDIPLTTVGVLFAISAGVGLFSQAVWGPVVDRFGRKPAMVAGLANEVMIMLGFALLGSLGAYAVLIALSGLIEPASRIGSDAMIADLIEPKKRAGAYALLRMVANAGVAFGPAVGGFLAATSYLLSFGTAATLSSIVLLLVIFLVKETKPELPEEEEEVGRPAGGYGHIARDFYFLAFCGASVLLWMAYEPFMQLLPVYMKEGFGILESGFGLIMATNALMVVFFQFAVTRVTEKYRDSYVMAAGAFFTGAGAVAAALSNNFGLFLLAMIILTIGELIWAPTSIAFVAKVAPIDMRGRYMGVYGVVGGIAWGIGPVLGGHFYDNVAPVSIWYLAVVEAIVGTLAFMLIGRVPALARQPSPATDPQDDVME